jgi:hypothetical protein
MFQEPEMALVIVLLVIALAISNYEIRNNRDRH